VEYRHLADIQDIETVAEYVESFAILDCQREMGVRYALGYAIGRPVPLAEFFALSEPIQGDSVYDIPQRT
jgi:diguanylate cyclase